MENTEENREKIGKIWKKGKSNTGNFVFDFFFFLNNLNIFKLKIPFVLI